MPVDPGRVQVRVVEMAGERAEQAQIFRNARDVELLQGTAQPGWRPREGRFPVTITLASSES